MLMRLRHLTPKSQHVMDFNHRINYDNVKIVKSESQACIRRVSQSLLINEKARLLNAINRNFGTNTPAVYVFTANK